MSQIQTVLCLLVIAALYTTGLNSCCKYQIAATLEVRFENFTFSNADSVLLIKTDRVNSSQHLDTIYYNLTTNNSFRIPVYDNDAENYSYIIKSQTPFFEHFITDIEAKRTNSLGCSGNLIKFSFKWNGKQCDYEKKHSVTIKP